MIKKGITISDFNAFVNSSSFFIPENRKNAHIYNFKPISAAKKSDVTFCSALGSDGKNLVSKSKATLVICPSSLKNKIKEKNVCLIYVDNPRLWFVKCMIKFSKTESKLKGKHASAILLTKKIGKNVYIGPFCYIGKNVTIEDNSIIHSNVSIYQNSKIGKNVTIDSGTVIGADGFGFERSESKKLEKFPHLGKVVIHDDVEIGANVCIDRGTLENTTIGKGSKIDNLVHIAHNVKIGKNCVVVAQSLVAGSCIMEDNSYIAMSATIREKIRIGENAFVGMGSVVTKDVKKNSTVFGVPAKVYKSKKKR